MIARLRAPLSEYREAVGRFSPAARRLLAILAALGIGYGVFSTLFTLYLAALGFDERFVGELVAVGTVTGALASVPAGAAFDRYGARAAFLGGLALTGLGIAIECLAVDRFALLAGAAIAAVGVAGAMVAQPPLLTAVSSERERTHLYGVAAAIGVSASVVGNLYAGVLPELLERWIAETALR